MTTFVWLAATFAIALGLALLGTPIVILGASKLKLFDSPDGARRMHDQPVPRMGGIAVFLPAAAIATFVLSQSSSLFFSSGPAGNRQGHMLVGILIGSVLMFIVGLVDDVRGLSPGMKSLAQVTARRLPGSMELALAQWRSDTEKASLLAFSDCRFFCSG
jgi:UDP-N-acetylmuramyl pentapeptide phosphotransferase/UDP-N-acetylglucosamine-1-phosphate transferase